MIAMQQANLYCHYPSIYWNTACIAAEAGGDIEEDFADLIDKGYIKIPIQKRLKLEVEYENYRQEFEEEDEITEDDKADIIKSLYENGDNDEESKKGTIDRGKIAASIGTYRNVTTITAPNINSSGYGFRPDASNNEIVCGLKIVGKIGNALIKTIIENRPYSDLTDFTNRVKISKDRVVNLIKANAFRDIEPCGRMELLERYILGISDQKKKLTMQNAQMLFGHNLLPFPEEQKVFNWYKYVTKAANKMLNGTYYILDDRAKAFYSSHNLDLLKIEDMYDKNGNIVSAVPKSYIENFYKSKMVVIKSYITAHSAELLVALNKELFSEDWNKYKCDNVLQGEMQSMRVYLKGHELEAAQFSSIKVTPITQLVENDIERTFITKEGTEIPIFNISNIIGTVINKDKAKDTITILTPEGTMNVKVWKDTFAHFDKKIVEFKGQDKIVVQPSFFENGTHLIVSGYLRGDTFIPKKYKNSALPEVIMKMHLQEDGSVVPEVKLENG